jgi:carbon-monoxide dehydrogenase iron sulfur subunit
MKRIFIDIDKCDGCKNCTIACMQSHRRDEGDVYTLNLTDLENESRNFMKFDHKVRVVTIFFRHCAKPECVMSCMSGAMVKDEETGLVSYDEEKCGSCFMCVMNCPFGVLKPDRKTNTKVIRCDFCKDDPEGPNCVRQCPTKAIYVKEVD